MLRFACTCVTVAALLPLVPVTPDPPNESVPAVLVGLADGTTVHLRDFRFVVEYSSSAKGEAPSAATVRRLATSELWTGKRILSLVGARLEVHREAFEKAEAVDADGHPLLVSRIEGAELVMRDGKRSKVKLLPPDESRLPEEKGRLVRPRAIDIEGEALLGGRATYCLVGFPPFVECPGRPEYMVTSLRLAP